MAVIGAVVAWFIVSARRPRLHRRLRDEEPDELLVARLLALTVSAGHPIGRALGEVNGRLPEHHRAAIDDILGRARHLGIARALVETRGPLSGLTARLAKAQVTGAPILPALDAYIAMVHDARRAAALEDARTIGVKLIIPLTLLLLPGFIALVIAPLVLEQLGGLLGEQLP
ncbi:MAG TPA: type II secretion system F family protein [Acidimicrobiia bacterium]|jgi:hypothetical protein